MSRRPVPLARYKCLTCGLVWTVKPGPVTCPRCKAIYVQWVNYNDHDWIGDGCTGPKRT